MLLGSSLDGRTMGAWIWGVKLGAKVTLSSPFDGLVTICNPPDARSSFYERREARRRVSVDHSPIHDSALRRSLCRQGSRRRFKTSTKCGGSRRVCDFLRGLSTGECQGLRRFKFQTAASSRYCDGSPQLPCFFHGSDYRKGKA